MLMRHRRLGLPLTRTITGIGLRQADFMVSARTALTRMYGLMSRIFIEAAKAVN
jgi:hypothetical protein